MPRATATMIPPSIDGLRFDSFAAASASVETMFREAVTIKDDNVLEVEKNKRQHVKSLVDALRHKGFKTAADPPKTKKDQAEGDQAEGVQL